MYRSQRVDLETLASDSTLAQANTWFINFFETCTYQGVCPTQSDVTPE